MTSDDAKRALMGWQGVVGVGERGGALVVFVERDTIAIPDEFSGYRLVKEVTGRIVAGLDEATRARLEPERIERLRVLAEELCQDDYLPTSQEQGATILALLSERAQTAPVLRAADQWVDARGGVVGALKRYDPQARDQARMLAVFRGSTEADSALEAAVAAWRAARGAANANRP